MPVDSDPGVAREIVATVEHAVRALGFDPSRIAGLAGTDGIVPGSVADALFDEAAAYLLDDSLALSIAARIPMGSLGALDYALCTSATLRDAIELVVKHYGVVTQRVRLELITTPPHATLRYVRVRGAIHSRHWVELSFGIIATRSRQTIGLTRSPFTAVSFRHSAPPRRDAHDEFFGVPVAFGADEDRLVFDAALLGSGLLTASRSLAEVLERQLVELAPAMGADPAVDNIRRTLAKLLDAGQVDLDSLATALATSKRTLQRTLGAHGTSHSELLDELRRTRAKELLEAGERVADVATRLGFADPSTFFRAYRRWTGSTPNADRE